MKKEIWRLRDSETDLSKLTEQSHSSQSRNLCWHFFQRVINMECFSLYIFISFIMFHLSYPIQCQNYNLYITIALKWTLISSRPNTLKFVFNIFVLFLALTISIINLRICHIPHKICWYLVEITWTFKKCIFIET